MPLVLHLLGVKVVPVLRIPECHCRRVIGRFSACVCLLKQKHVHIEASKWHDRSNDNSTSTRTKHMRVVPLSCGRVYAIWIYLERDEIRVVKRRRTSVSLNV